MFAGETSIGTNGYENCLFPMDYMNCSQVSGPSSYSHCCGHACDWVGAYNNYPVYAPFTGHVVADNQGTGHTRFFSSDNMVNTPTGLSYVSIQLTHANNPPAGTHFNQGDFIYTTGTQGFVTGDHLHLDQDKLRDAIWINYGVTCSAGNACYAMRQSKQPYEVFFIDGNETIVNLQGMQFVEVGGYIPPEPPEPSERKKILLYYGFILNKKKELLKEYLMGGKK